ncbi:hypothetical protein SARC_02994 [Sphaeroforma arctica JP610]|uniref:GRIP domain-containing protein n=1 Tax=Sphaeroforma arctica JP610 TaxID=667725 RepID=A0A0L0G6Z0_9EUKA|nr:hypothetical protein SARC_02994 [Sphaeroforma arctica JP610]KNC84785.1 hypothetical protein SARC_02994 [Sphaeroforma arctica JP610]|eukprot:XP_014158687.1 hypothetical protein SARC_02994 [Sphaeroforma arctica JP610]
MAVSNSTDGSHESENERLRLEVEFLRKKLADTQSRPESWKFPVASECDKIKLDNSSHGMDSNGSEVIVNQLSTMKLILATRDDDQMRQDSDVEDDATTKTIIAQLREQLQTLKTDAAQIVRVRDDISGRLKASDIQLKEQIDTSAKRATRVTGLEQRVHEKDKIIDELRAELREFMIEAEELVASQASLSAELEQKDEEMELQMESYAEALRVDTEPAGNMNEGQLDYLHHIVFKYMSGVQQKQLVPVIATILKFTAAEMKAVMPPR